MAQKEKVQDTFATAEEAALVDQFAAFAKAYFVYPETNHRVRETIDEFLAEVAGYSQELQALEIFVRRDHLRSASGRLDTDRPLLQWLRGCLLKTILSGLRLEQGMTREGLLAFLRRLRDNCALREKEKHKDFKFVDLWPDEYPGVTLREQSFLGGYHDNPVSMGLSDEGREIATVRAAIDMTTTEGEALAETIETSNGVLEKIKRIERVLQSRGIQDAPEMSLDLLGEIVNHLPAEAVADPSYAEKNIEEILDNLEPFITGLVMRSTSSETRDQKQKVGRALATIIDDFFGGQTASGPDTMARGPELARPGDELVTDDVDACLEKLEALPDVKINLDSEDPYVEAETLGACLHRLSYCPRDASARSIYDKITPLLEDPDEETRKVLMEYSEALLGEDTDRESQNAAKRVFGHLRSCELLAQVRKCGAFTVDSLVFAFPTGFLLFLDSLDTKKRTSDREELQDLCFRVGDERIRRDEPTLIESSGVLRADRAEKILLCPSARVLSLARIIARHGGRNTRQLLVTYLLGLEIDRPEVAALRILEPVDRIPQSYLVDLCEGELKGGNYKKKMLQYTGFLICSYIDELANEERTLDRRVYAILTLKDFPGPGTEELLKKLSKGRGPLGIFRPPKAIRKAVATVRARLGLGR